MSGLAIRYTQANPASSVAFPCQKLHSRDNRRGSWVPQCPRFWVPSASALIRTVCALLQADRIKQPLLLVHGQVCCLLGSAILPCSV